MIATNPWLILIGALLGIGGCSKFAVCPSPGGLTKESCYYRLEVVEDLGDGKYEGRVARDVIEKNIDDSWPLINKYDTNDYPFYLYVFRIQPNAQVEPLKVKGVYDLENVPGTHFLRPLTEETKKNWKY